MRVYDLVKELKEAGTFDILCRGGIIPVYVVTKLRYYESFLHHRKQGHNKTTAVALAADDNAASESTIYFARSFFESTLT